MQKSIEFHLPHYELSQLSSCYLRSTKVCSGEKVRLVSAVSVFLDRSNSCIASGPWKVAWWRLDTKLLLRFNCCSFKQSLNRFWPRCRNLLPDRSSISKCSYMLTLSSNLEILLFLAFSTFISGWSHTGIPSRSLLVQSKIKAWASQLHFSGQSAALAICNRQNHKRTKNSSAARWR